MSSRIISNEIYSDSDAEVLGSQATQSRGRNARGDSGQGNTARMDQPLPDKWRIAYQRVLSTIVQLTQNFREVDDGLIGRLSNADYNTLLQHLITARNTAPQTLSEAGAATVDAAFTIYAIGLPMWNNILTVNEMDTNIQAWLRAEHAWRENGEDERDYDTVFKDFWNRGILDGKKLRI